MGNWDGVWDKTAPANTYGMNMYLLRIPGIPCNTGTYNDNFWMPKRLYIVYRPSEARALVGVPPFGTAGGNGDVLVPGSFNLGRLGDLTRHPVDMSNVLFCDGHVDARRSNTVLDRRNRSWFSGRVAKPPCHDV